MNTEKVNIVKRCNAIIADEKADASSKFYAHFVVDTYDMNSADREQYAVNMNRASLIGAINGLFTDAGFDWMRLIRGTTYPVLDINADADADPVKIKTVKASDCFAIKQTKNSKKSVIPADIYCMLEMFGGNLCEEYVKTRNDAEIHIRVFSKYSTDADCFFSDAETGRDATSMAQLEKQFQVILNTLVGADIIKAKKKYVRHLSDMFIKANSNGWRNGNAVALLNHVINHAQDALYERNYSMKSGLAVHKDPEKKTGKKSKK